MIGGDVDGGGDPEDPVFQVFGVTRSCDGRAGVPIELVGLSVSSL
jgi:hypothetical protein